MSAVRSSTAQVGDRQHQHAEHAVGAVDQRQALLGGQLDRRRARPRRAPRRPASACPTASRTSPSPISASAQCESGARSPEQPSEPYSCTTGVMPALSRPGHQLAPSPGVRRCGRSPASRAAAASARGPPRARPPGRSRRRASGPATAAAGRASRSGCAGWRARRSRSRSRTPGWARRRARRRRRGPARSRPARRRSSATGAPSRATATTSSKDSAPTPTSTVPGRCRNVGRGRRTHATIQRPAAASAASPAADRVRLGSETCQPGETMRTARALAALAGVLVVLASPPAARHRSTPESKKADSAATAAHVGLAAAPTPAPSDPGAAQRHCAAPTPTHQGPDAARSRVTRAGPRRGHQLAAVPEGHGHPGEAGQGSPMPGRRGPLRGPRPDQRARLRTQPVPGQPGRLGARAGT